METTQASNLFQDWYNTYVLPKKQGPYFGGAKPDMSLGVTQAPAAVAPTALPTSATPTPEAPVAIPPAPAQEDPVDAESAALDAAAGNQDGGWTGPTPGATILDSIKSGVKRFGEGVSNLSDPVKMGLLGTGLSMMATPPRAIPYSNTEILGKSGLAGLGIYEKALEDKRKADLMAQTAEEHKLALQERTDWHRADIENKQERTKLEAKKEESQRIVRMANAQRARAQAGRSEDLRQLVPQEYADAINMPEAAGMTWEQFNKSQGATVATIKPSPDKFVTSDDGTVTVIRDGEPVARLHGMGKTKSPPAGTKGGSEKAYQQNWRLAKEALPAGSTNEQIAAKMLEMFPPSAVQAATAKKKGSSLRPGGAVAAPAGFKDSGKTSGGKKVWISPDGKSAWVAP